MENKIIYIGQEIITSKKKNQDYCLIYYILNHKPKTDFVTREVYDKILLKKLQELKEYTAIYNTQVVGQNIQAVLFDIK